MFIVSVLLFSKRIAQILSLLFPAVHLLPSCLGQGETYPILRK